MRDWRKLLHRLLPDSYYDNIIRKIHNLLGDRVRFHIYSQSRDDRWRKPTIRNAPQDVYLNEKKGKGAWNYPQPYKYELHLDEDWRADFDHMVIADIMITSVSSFGYFAANLNENYKIIPETPGFLRTFQHAPATKALFTKKTHIVDCHLLTSPDFPISL